MELKEIRENTGELVTVLLIDYYLEEFIETLNAIKKDGATHIELSLDFGYGGEPSSEIYIQPLVKRKETALEAQERIKSVQRNQKLTFAYKEFQEKKEYERLKNKYER